MMRIAMSLVVVTLAGCSFPVTKMEPVNSASSGAPHSADKKNGVVPAKEATAAR